MHVETIQSQISDNFFYAVADDDGRCLLIDPVDADTAIARVRERGWALEFVVNTHFHHDHVGGDDAVLDAFEDARLVVGAGDADHIASSVASPIHRRLDGGDVVALGELELDVLDTPGHTPGHISLRLDDLLFSGDTIFVCGAGNCSFGGDPGVLFLTFRDVLSTLPDEVTFFPGHDYAVRDIEFALSLEPGDERAEELLARAKASGGDLFTTTLGEERSYSPFFRFDDEALAATLRDEHPDVWRDQDMLSASSEETVFRTVRALRNHW